MKLPKAANQSLVREMNTSIIMDRIRLNAPLSRSDLATQTGLTRSTVSLIIDRLIDLGFVHETTIRHDPKVGRPGTLLQFNPSGGFAVGMELGVDFITVVVTNFISEVLWRDRQDSDPREDRSSILVRAENLISQAVEVGIQLGLRPLGIGVGVPGLVDTPQGKLVYGPNLQWTDLPLRELWLQRFGLPVFVENEANCACLGEYFYGAAHNIKNFLYLKSGFGLGGGIMIDGQLFRGANGFAGEIGHMALYQDGPLCGCGRVGCWETFVRPANLLADITTRLENGEKSLISALPGGDKVTLSAVVEAAQKQDAMVMRAIEAHGRHYAAGISNLVNLFNPELVVLGGAISPINPWLIPVIEAALQTNVLHPLRELTRIEASLQGEDACLLGAIALVLDNIWREPLSSLEPVTSTGLGE